MEACRRLAILGVVKYFHSSSAQNQFCLEMVCLSLRLQFVPGGDTWLVLRPFLCPCRLSVPRCRSSKLFFFALLRFVPLSPSFLLPIIDSGSVFDIPWAVCIDFGIFKILERDWIWYGKCECVCAVSHVPYPRDQEALGCEIVNRLRAHKHTHAHICLHWRVIFVAPISDKFFWQSSFSRRQTEVKPCPARSKAKKSFACTNIQAKQEVWVCFERSNFSTNGSAGSGKFGTHTTKE